MSLKIALPGGAGLVGQNLIVRLKARGYNDIIVIDKHAENLEVLRELHPDIVAIEADLAEKGIWQNLLHGVDVLVMLQAQIGAKDSDPFFRNNIQATNLILESIDSDNPPYIIHISSSVVESVADDNYTNTKREQERLVRASKVACTVLRPTLMFGWFDRKHFGWLARFMKRVPVFPIPGSGRYMRQPLYVLDFCDVIIACIELRPMNKCFNISGFEKIDYIDIIKLIKKSVRAKTVIVRIPYAFFHRLLMFWSWFDSDPPFTVQQLEALVAGDEFEVMPWPKIFNVKPTSFEQAIEDTFNHLPYSDIELKF
ncbi:nucleoside-diphosphate-sugar epimerase [Oleiphilus messinensis]|uniref:Nucleoside-diphosphate-sugar epimerase n=1 Tax=Oleiphilus messinensis TaxID=141451 RepID=A0A1Y0I6B0_9GAMM|nr:NAD(P)-dependent oxidoreductase [Oleiphilus messinensis]ARU56022.1 nucleoside-diphosphate-sugar epimerase [Oleiphilus messinensis]